MTASRTSALTLNGEGLRYILNGIMAAAVHFAVLTFSMELLAVSSAGIANFIAATFGTTTSFLGNRYYVFRRVEEPIATQAARFVALYASTACLHGVILLVWSDLLGLDYRLGFLLATAAQVALSFLGNKFLVFNQ
jgi:putative flippase GtrA